LEGEIAVAAVNPKHFIARTSWVYAPFGTNFVRTMLRLAGERDQLGVVDDQLGCPTYAPDIASAILALALRWTESGWRDEHAGVTNLAGPDLISWCGFARMIMDEAANRGGKSAKVDAITSAQYPTAAKRPAFSGLSTAKLAATFDLRLPSLQGSLTSCVERLMQESQARGAPA
jgi:dTDP-4-dehydrorhamnose reductase